VQDLGRLVEHQRRLIEDQGRRLDELQRQLDEMRALVAGLHVAPPAVPAVAAAEPESNTHRERAAQMQTGSTFRV